LLAAFLVQLFKGHRQRHGFILKLVTVERRRCSLMRTQLYGRTAKKEGGSMGASGLWRFERKHPLALAVFLDTPNSRS